MQINVPMRMAGLAVLCAGGMLAQDERLPSSSVQINLGGANSPVAVLSLSSDQSRTSARGGAMVLDLHMSLMLRNIGGNRIHGVTLQVVAQEAAKGGKGSVTYPSLNIGPGEAFPVRIDMQLWRPTQLAAGPLVQVNLDGVLYQDLSFYGPDRLHSQRYLTACELEAQRDREYFKRVLSQSGKPGLQQAIYEVRDRLARQNELAPLNVKVLPVRPSVTSAALPAEREERFAFLRFPDAPVEPLNGSAQIAGNEARTPHIEVVNRSGKTIQYVEMGWVLSDQAGRQSIAASLPSPEATLYLPPGKTASVQQDSTLRLFSGTRPVNVQRMTGFVSQVQFADGKVWVPNRHNLEDPALQKVVPPSAEAQRLSDLCVRKGLEALIEELKKF